MQLRKMEIEAERRMASRTQNFRRMERVVQDQGEIASLQLDLISFPNGKRVTKHF